MSAHEPTLETRIEIRKGYVFVWQRGLATSLSELEALQKQIEAALKQAGTRSVLFDNRDTESPDEWIRASMWTWLSENLDRAALIQNEKRNISRAERTGERNRISVRAFHDERDAEAWLLGSLPRA